MRWTRKLSRNLSRTRDIIRSISDQRILNRILTQEEARKRKDRK